MAGKGKGTARKEASKKRAAVSGSSRAGLVFPVGRMTRYLRAKRLSERCSGLAGCFMAAVLEYLVDEILDQAGDRCLEEPQNKNQKKPRIKPRHLQQAIWQDDELHKLCHQIQISEGGYQATTETMALLWPKHKTAQKAGAAATQEE